MQEMIMGTMESTISMKRWAILVLALCLAPIFAADLVASAAKHNHPSGVSGR